LLVCTGNKASADELHCRAHGPLLTEASLLFPSTTRRQPGGLVTVVSPWSMANRPSTITYM
jgi:hypothetical protein